MKIIAMQYDGEGIYNEFIGKATRFSEFLNNKINCGLSNTFEFPRHGVERIIIKATGYDDAIYRVDLSTSEANMTRYDEVVFSTYKKNNDSKYEEIKTNPYETTNINKLMTEYDKFLVRCFSKKYEKELEDFNQEFDEENVHSFLLSMVNHISLKQKNNNVVKNIIKGTETIIKNTVNKIK